MGVRQTRALRSGLLGPRGAEKQRPPAGRPPSRAGRWAKAHLLAIPE